MTSYNPHPAFRPRRLGVTGGTVLSPASAVFCQHLGQALAGQRGLVVVTGGYQCMIDRPDLPSADWTVIQGMCSRLTGKEERRLQIETLLPERDIEGIVRFTEGQITRLPNRNAQARRFKVVVSSDVIMAIEGSKGTREFIDLSLTLEKPCLPLPFTGGIAAERWQQHRNDIITTFDLPQEVVAAWEHTSLASLNEAEMAALAEQVVQCIRNTLKPKCFVMMPFHDEDLPLYQHVIKPAVSESGFEPIRADHLNRVGNAVEALHSAIQACDCAVAVITGHNPNVMYELGFAHALGKPVLIACRAEAPHDMAKQLPFDIRNEYVVPYAEDRQAFKQAMTAILQELRV